MKIFATELLTLPPSYPLQIKVQPAPPNPLPPPPPPPPPFKVIPRWIKKFSNLPPAYGVLRINSPPRSLGGRDYVILCKGNSCLKDFPRARDIRNSADTVQGGSSWRYESVEVQVPFRNVLFIYV